MNEKVMLSRLYPISPERLYKLLSEPSMLEQWFSPSDDVRVEVIQHQFHVEGLYQLRYTETDGTTAIVSGNFVEIVAPQRIRFTWRWQEPDIHAGIDTLVCWEIEPTELGSKLHVTHTRLPDSVYADRHQAGWSGALERLFHTIEDLS